MSHFYYLFRKETGTVPAAYVRRLRYEKARELLTNSSFSVKEITGLVGIHDVSHFVRDFQKIYGMSPRTFRRAYWRDKHLKEDGLQERHHFLNSAIKAANRP